MPLYEYACDSCGARFERIQKFSDPPASTCPTCGGPVQKLISSPAIQFKGSGFYITDYARSGQKSSEGSSSDSSGSKDGASKEGASKDTSAGKDSSSSSESSKPAADSSAAKPSKAPAKTESKS